LYGDSSSDVLQKLYSSPAATIPVVLARLEQKVDEWTRARSEMQVWATVCARSFHVLVSSLS
jgi:histone deacetylase complex regulatory component SIN3